MAPSNVISTTKWCIGNKSEHTTGIWKGRWGSLEELRLTLSTEKQSSFALAWVMECVVLHNLCMENGDGYRLPPSADPSPESSVSPLTGARPRRQEVLGKVRAFITETGIFRETKLCKSDEQKLWLTTAPSPPSLPSASLAATHHPAVSR